MSFPAVTFIHSTDFYMMLMYSWFFPFMLGLDKKCITLILLASFFSCEEMYSDIFIICLTLSSLNSCEILVFMVCHWFI